MNPFEAVVTDRLLLAHALENGGISRDAAEHIATEIFDAIHDNVATKTDLREMETRLQTNIDAVRADLRIETERVRSELIRWVVGIGFAQVATIIAVLKLAPGGHP